MIYEYMKLLWTKRNNTSFFFKEDHCEVELALRFSSAKTEKFYEHFIIRQKIIRIYQKFEEPRIA